MAQTASKKWLGIGLVVVVAIIALLIWNKQRQNHSSELVIGISPSFAHPLQVAADEAKQQGLNVKLVEFSDWNTPNITLNHGDIDANFFQHQPFLDNAIKETGFKLKSFAAGAASFFVFAREVFGITVTCSSSVLLSLSVTAACFAAGRSKRKSGLMPRKVMAESYHRVALCLF